MSIIERLLWEKQISGLIIPSGREGHFREHNKDSFVAIKGMANQVRELYSEYGIVLNPSSNIMGLMNDIDRISDAWLLNNTKSVPTDAIFRICHGYRICSAIASVRNEPGISEHLKILASGNLDLLKRAPSRAKDFLWEIELFVALKEKGFSPLFEEPDISILVNNVRVSVACKKIYSEKNIVPTISKAVKQIQRSKRHGLIAINIDDLQPEGSIVTGSSSDSTLDFLTYCNQKFIQRHEDCFRKYMKSSRIVACLISTSMISDSTNEMPRINNHHQETIWVIPDIGTERQRIADDLYLKIYQKFPS